MNNTPVRAAVIGALAFITIGVLVAVGAIVYDKESKRPSAQERAYLERARAARAKQEAETKAQERAAFEAGAEEAKKKWREENGIPEQSEPLIGQALVNKALTLEVGTTLEDARKALGRESGSCWAKKDKCQMHIWDVDSGHLPLTLPFRDQKLLKKPERPKEGAEARALLMQLVLQGDCFEVDPK